MGTRTKNTNAKTLFMASVCCAISAACGPHNSTKNPNNAIENSQTNPLLAVGVEVLEAVDLPTIQLIRRQGDPRVALGIAIFPPGGSVETTALSALLRHRLLKAGVLAQVHTTSLAVLVVIELAINTEVDTELVALHQALTTKVAESEPLAAQLAEYLKALGQHASRERSEVGLCEGNLGSEGSTALRQATPTPPDAIWLEGIRNQAVVAGRVGIAAIGSGPLLRQVSTLHKMPWTPGPPPDDSWLAATETMVLPAEGAHEIRIALRVSDSERALSAARALRAPSHPLHSRLRGFSSRFDLSHARVTLRPAGACLGVTLVIDEASGEPTSDQVAGVSLLVLQELKAAAEQSLTDDERTLALVEPQTAVETAALAAWAAVRSPLTGHTTARLVEYRGASDTPLRSASLKARFDATEAAWQKRSIPVLSKDETGQAQLYLMLGSVCGTLAEPSTEAGLRALAVHSLARQFSGYRGVKLLPYVSAQGVGLVGHSAKVRGESNHELAERVARALGGAFSGAEVDGRVVAAARSKQLADIGSDPGTALIHSIFGGDFVSALEPRGIDNTVSGLSTIDVERSREEMAREPLRLAVLFNGDSSQVEVAERAAAQWLANEREHIVNCPTPSLKAAAPGQWTLETMEESVNTGAYVGTWAAVRPEVGHAYAHYLTTHPHLLTQFSLPAVEPDTSPNPVGLVQHFDAVWQGNLRGGALFIHVGAAEGQLNQSVEQVRLGLQNLSQVGLNPAEVEELRREFARRQKRTLDQPLGRLVQLWSDRSPLSPTAAELAVLGSELRADQHRVVLVKRRK